MKNFLLILCILSFLPIASTAFAEDSATIPSRALQQARYVAKSEILQRPAGAFLLGVLVAKKAKEFARPNRKKTKEIINAE